MGGEVSGSGRGEHWDWKVNRILSTEPGAGQLANLFVRRHHKSAFEISLYHLCETQPDLEIKFDGKVA